MAQKLKTIVVDDDPLIIGMIEDLCRDSKIVTIIKTFMNPKEFLEKAPLLDFDLCLLDIQMPEMEGLVVAQMLKNKPFIFITGADSKLRDALNLAPVDIVTKPILKDRLDKALNKAYELFVDKKEYEVFSIAESKKKTKVHLPDILLAVTDTVDPRHKTVFMRNGEKYTLMECTLEKLLDMCPLLVQANKAEAVSLEIVNEIEHDMITIKGVAGKDAPKYVTLGRAFSKAFKERLYYNR
jgi:two-component system LytT family response regulator